MTPEAERLWGQNAKQLSKKGVTIYEVKSSASPSIRKAQPLEKNAIYISSAILLEWCKSDLLIEVQKGRWCVSSSGVANLRRLVGGFSAQHQIRVPTTNDVGSAVLRNSSETALDWLVSRKGGRFSLIREELEAAKRLRQDFEQAHMASRLTMDWTQTPRQEGSRRAGGHEVLPNSAIDARKRLARALDYVGPVLSDVLIDICCHQSGLQESEARFGMPSRSAKVILKTGLMRLSVHYGIQTQSAASASLRIR